MKITFLIAICLSPLLAFSAEITKDNFPGYYKIEAKALGRRATFHLKAINSNECEVSKEREDGTMGQWCNGTYTINKEWADIGTHTIIKTLSTCPSDRTQEITLNLNLKSAQVRDLERGTSVEITSKDLPFSVFGKMKKQ